MPSCLHHSKHFSPITAQSPGHIMLWTAAQSQCVKRLQRATSPDRTLQSPCIEVVPSYIQVPWPRHRLNQAIHSKLIFGICQPERNKGWIAPTKYEYALSISKQLKFTGIPVFVKGEVLYVINLQRYFAQLHLLHSRSDFQHSAPYDRNLLG